MLGQKYLETLTITIISILKPNLTLEGIYQTNQFVMNYMTNMKDKLTAERISPAGNRRLAQWRVSWLIEHPTSHQLLWCIDSFLLRNPPLSQAPNRQAVKNIFYSTQSSIFTKRYPCFKPI